jgi:uncharacterized protein YlzI (FlbEa/FlbD family)
MTRRFVDLKLVDGSRLIVNATYITQVSTTHGNDFGNGAEVYFLTLGEDGQLVCATVPATQVPTLVGALIEDDSRFIHLTTSDGQETILNSEYITHIEPTHGSNLADGADVIVWGTVIQVPASKVSAIVSFIGGAE